MSLLSPCILACSQTPANRVFEAVKEYVGKQQNPQKHLSMQLLKSASKIIYGFNNGTVHPDYHYQGYIIVTSTKVTLEIHNKSSLYYSNSKNLSSEQYSAFLNSLLKLGVKQNPNEPMMSCGGGGYDLTIKKNETVVFKGTEDEEIVTARGRLCDAFTPLLNIEMRNIYNNPSVTFDSSGDMYPDDYQIYQ